MTITYQWRGPFDNTEVNMLHAEGFDLLRATDNLVGFLNVAWDGTARAFVLDTLVVQRVRRQGRHSPRGWTRYRSARHRHVPWRSRSAR
jgi:hypothetical protein